jgi:pyruvate kinase
MGFSDRTDIWFTIGPESNNPEMINGLLDAGATGARLTFSYGTPDLHEQFAEMLTKASAVTGRPCTIVADLGGEKVRLERFPTVEQINVGQNDDVRLVADSNRADIQSRHLPIDSERFLEQLCQGDRVFIGDGAVELEVVTSDESTVECKVSVPGTIEQGRGLIVQNGDFEPRALTDKDREHLDTIGQSDCYDVVEISFVSNREEVDKTREILADHDTHVPIVAKIETASGIENAQAIADAADALMIARGDLALHLPWTELGHHVERVVEAAEATETPWIMATQVVEGLERFAFPTRAELCDLDRWRKRGVDGILLSRETAFGSDPVRAVSAVRDVLNVSATNS